MLDYVSDDEVRPAKRNATYQDVLDAPEHMVAEILDGDLFLFPRPAPRHALATTVLMGTVLPVFHQGLGGPGGWTILFEPELHIGPDIVVPDLAGWKYERMPDVPETAYFSDAPDWACEVLSPSTERIDRGRKLRIYARERVSYLWLVSSIRRTLEVYTRKGQGWSEPTIYRDEAVVHVEPFAAIELPLERLWLKQNAG
jgi:Uma2 family endonuclease